MRISDVLRSLRAEFPAVSHSKLRFLEEQGLVHPVRTPAGYRQYSPADVERLRFVLVEQRDRYLPLKVIKDKLAALDRGAASSDQPLIPRLATKDGESAAGPEGALTLEVLAVEAGVELSFVEELVTAGVLRPGPRGRFDPVARDVVVLAAGLGEHGIGPRHLRGLRAAADRQVALVDQVIAPVRAQQAPSARARAATTASELGEMCAQLHTAWLRQGIADLAT
ncbi:MerR family transcriptional regulator [Sanguibacter sp. YZGR15]|uniref:MerR family transcriptional regulator n=2 Tax=Sanguibacter suaedae TaxID=2795737 RepID=A0A934I556_9MICO|nr:MerR family transcriptional regulator [Sanguibacter suaedae]